ncbi:MAG: hypothetical protein H7836_16600, partial [Magnetococcus sp. YQC-3]
ADAPTSTIGLLGSQFSVSGKPSGELVLAVECDKRKGAPLSNLLIRSADVPSGSSKQFYDMAQVWIATDGQGAADVLLGQLYVSYDVTLFSATTRAPGSDVLAGYYTINNAASATPLGATDGTDQVVVGTDRIGMTVSGTGTVITFDRNNTGTFLFVLMYNHANGAVTLGSVTVGGGANNVSGYFPPSAYGLRGPDAGKTAATSILLWCFSQADPTQQSTLTLSGFTLPAVSSAKMMCVQLYPAL